MITVSHCSFISRTTCVFIESKLLPLRAQRERKSSLCPHGTSYRPGPCTLSGGVGLGRCLYGRKEIVLWCVHRVETGEVSSATGGHFQRLRTSVTHERYLIDPSVPLHLSPGTTPPLTASKVDHTRSLSLNTCGRPTL